MHVAKLMHSKLCVYRCVDSTLNFLLVGYDCGVYALCFAEAMCRIKLLSDPESILQNISGSYVDKWRTDTKLMIGTLAKEAQ